MTPERRVEVTRQHTKENDHALREWLDTRGIQAVIFDLDDTLLDTFAWEMKHEVLYLSEVHSHVPEFPLSDLTTIFRNAHEQAMEKESIHRDRFTTAIAILSEQHGSEVGELFASALPILFHVYEDAPEMLPGAREALESFVSSGRKLGLVTHAEDSYTQMKLDVRDIKKYFGAVVVADARGTKSAKDWKAAIDALGVLPHEVLVVGDNVKGDILAAREAGVMHTVALPSPWDIHRTAQIPETSMKAVSIREVIPTLLMSS